MRRNVLPGKNFRFEHDTHKFSIFRKVDLPDSGITEYNNIPLMQRMNQNKEFNIHSWRLDRSYTNFGNWRKKQLFAIYL